MATNVDLRFLKKNDDKSMRSAYPTGDFPYPGYDIYWLVGQSNMVGKALFRASGQDQDYSAVAGKVFQYGFNSQTITAASNPLDHQNEAAGEMGLWLQFCKDMLPKTSGQRQILLVPAAKGGTSFNGNDWPVGGTAYVPAKSRINAAMTQGSGTNVLKGVLWIQGESDADQGTTAATNHLAAMQAMYNDMLAGVTGMTAATPFILATIIPTKTNANTINSNLLSFANSNAAGVKFVDCTDLSFFDNNHYSAASLDAIGTRFAARIPA